MSGLQEFMNTEEERSFRAAGQSWRPACAALAALAMLFVLLPPARAQRAGGARSPIMRQPLNIVGARYGFPAPSKADRIITFKSVYSTVAFETNSRKLWFNGTLIWMNGAVLQDKNGWTVETEDVTKVIDPLLRAENALAGAGFSTVVLDPGHGGDDTGAIGRRRVYEKKVVLDIADRVRDKLRASGVNVRLTRDSDIGMSLASRPAKAREWKADLFVSIHVNAAHNSRAHGIETYIMPAAGYSSTAGNVNKNSFSGNRHDRANLLLAYYVQKEMLASTLCADRGVRRARFDVLKDAPCPAVLVECGFVSNKGEEEKMLTRSYRDSVASGIATGIMEYIKTAKSASSAR